MSNTESDTILARYREVVKEVDAFNRIIGVRRLRPSELTKVAGMTSELSGYDELRNKDGIMIQVPHRMPLQIAAAVCLIDDAHIPFPRSRGELDAIYDRLDMEGIKAAGMAVMKLAQGELPLNDAVEGVIVDDYAEAKN